MLALQSPQLVLLASIVIMGFGIIFGFFIFPFALHSQIKAQLNLAPGSRLRPFYEKPPFYLNFLVHVFNVTNKNEVIQGKKPRLQEIGPYVFEEWKEKFNMVDNEEEDSVTFHYKNTFIFRPDLSGNLTGDEIIVMPHPLIAGAILASAIDRPVMLPRIEGGLNNLFHNPTDAFYTGRVMDVLFDGVEIDCSGSDPFSAAICSVLEGEKAVRKIDEHRFAFSLLGGYNGSDLGEMKTNRGKRNHKDVGRLMEVNGKTETDIWSDTACNAYNGTDATIVPPLIVPEEGIVAFDPVVCRSFRTAYTKRQARQSGIPIHIFELDISDESNAKDCFCRTKDTCPAHGAFDLFRCTGVPMIATLPHFYKAEALLDGIESGLSPNKSFHELYVHMEILTGAPIEAAKRLQFNLDMKPIPQIEIMKSMPEILFPLVWLEESVHIDKPFIDQIRWLYWGIYFVVVLKWSCLALGMFGILGTGAWVIISGEGWSSLFLNPIKHEASENMNTIDETKPSEDNSHTF